MNCVLEAAVLPWLFLVHCRGRWNMECTWGGMWRMAWQIPQLGRLKSSSVAMKTAFLWFVPIWVHSWMIQAKCPSQNGPRSKGLVGHGSGRSCCTSTRRDPLESPEKGSATRIFRDFPWPRAGSLHKWKSRVQRLLQCPSAHRGFLRVKVGRLGIQRMIAFRHYLSAGLMQVTVWSGTQLLVVLGLWVSTRAGQDNSSACVVARWSLSRSESTDSVQVQMRIWLAKLSKLSREKVGANNPNIYIYIFHCNYGVKQHRNMKRPTAISKAPF